MGMGMGMMFVVDHGNIMLVKVIAFITVVLGVCF